jgi:hypothetical protein
MKFAVRGFSPGGDISFMKQSPGREAGTLWFGRVRLGNAPLAVAVRIIFFIHITLTAFFLALAGLSGLVLPWLLAGILAWVLAELAALLALLFHIVCHQNSSWETRASPRLIN